MKVHVGRALISVLAVIGAGCFFFGEAAALPPSTQSAAGDSNTQTKAKPITLARAHRLALAHNPSLKNIKETVYQSEVLINRAWSVLLPNLSANAAIVRNSEETEIDFVGLLRQLGLPIDPNIPNQPQTMQELWNKSFGFSANIAIFDARAIPGIKMAYDNQELSQQLGKYQRNELLHQVSQAYYQVHSTQQMVKTNQENLANARQFLRDAKLKKQVGAATKIDLLRAQIQVMSAEKNLANAKDAVKLARTALAHLIGIKEPITCVEPPPPPISQGSLQTLTHRALSNRLDLRASRIQHRISLRSRQETWTKWIPTFDLTYNWNWNSAAGFATKKDSWQLIFGAKWSLLQGGDRIAELAERQSKIRTANNDIQQSILTIRKEVKESYLEREQRKRNFVLAKKQVKLADETHQMVTKQYKNGMASSLDVLNAATELENRRTSLVIEKLAYNLSQLMLYRALGGLVKGA